MESSIRTTRLPRRLAASALYFRWMPCFRRASSGWMKALLKKKSAPAIAGTEVQNALTELKSRHALRAGNDVAEGLDQLRTILAARSIEQVIAGGLHEFIDFIQRYLIAITIRLSTAFFGHAPEAEGAERAYGDFPPLGYSSQVQTQNR